MEQQDLLQDLEQEIYLERASAGARFANYLLDVVGFYLLFLIVFVFIAFSNARPSVSTDESFSGRQSQGDLTIFIYFICYLTYITYYTVFEGATKGRTLGKLITGTRVVKLDGSPITWKDALLRSLCRIVPFEPFSAFGTPWHDKWTETQVVKIRR